MHVILIEKPIEQSCYNRLATYNIHAHILSYTHIQIIYTYTTERSNSADMTRKSCPLNVKNVVPAKPHSHMSLFRVQVHVGNKFLVKTIKYLKYPYTPPTLKRI